MPNISVLTLGWEFPPAINGGLGVASFGLGEALGKLVDVEMIVPKSDPARLSGQMEVTGLNEVDVETLIRETRKTHTATLSRVHIEYVDVHLTGYEQPVIRKENHRTLIVEKPVKEGLVELPRRFRIDNLYGHDLSARMMEYTDIASRMARSKTFDLIHAHDWMTFLAGLEIKAWSGKPLVLHIHSLDYDRNGPDHQGYVFELEKHAMQEADLIFAVSDYTADIIKKKYRIPAAKVITVRNGIEEAVPVRKSPPFPEKLVLFVGRLVPQKGPDHFLKIAQMVLEQYAQVRFAVVGQGPLLPDLVNSVAQARLGDRIHFTGFLDHDRVQELMSMAEVLVMPSVSEPFGLVAIEAAQAGVACVISRQSGVSEVLTHALKAGYDEPELMANYVVSLLQHPHLKEEMVAGMKENLKEISWDLSAEIVFAAFERLLKR